MSQKNPTSLTEECTIAYLQRTFLPKASIWSLPPITHFADMAAIFEFIVSNIYYRMLWGQIHIYLPPEHPIIKI